MRKSGLGFHSVLVGSSSNGPHRMQMFNLYIPDACGITAILIWHQHRLDDLAIHQTVGPLDGAILAPLRHIMSGQPPR